MKRYLKVSMAAMLILALSACGASDPKQTLVDKMAKNKSLSSYSFQGDLTLEQIKFTPKEEVVDSDLGLLETLDQISGSKVTFDGKYVKNKDDQPYRMDMNLSVNAGSGDATVQFKLPMIMTQNQTYVQIPDSPVTDMLGVETLSANKGKYVLIETPVASQMDAASVESAEKFSSELASTLLNGLDSKTYFREAKVADIKSPFNTKIDTAIDIFVTDESFTPFAKHVIDKIPSILDIMSKDEYKTVLGASGIDTTVLEQVRSNYDASKDKIVTELENLKKSFTIKDMKYTMAFDKSDRLAYDGILVDISVDSANGTWDLKLKMDMHYTDQNKEIQMDQLPADAVELEEIAGISLGAPIGVDIPVDTETQEEVTPTDGE